MNRDDVQGAWRLLSWVQWFDDGRVVEPMGDDPIGIISYVGNYMSCHISRRNRALPSSGGQWTADVSDKAGAYDSYLAYSGTFEIDDDVIVHHVEISLFQPWVGHKQCRRAELDRGSLRLTARLEDSTAEARTAELIWTRLENGRPVPTPSSE